MNTYIRPLGEGDISVASALIWSTFLEFEAPDYTPQGIETFRRFIAPETMATQLRNQQMQAWGAFRQGVLVGILATRDISHISLLFVEKTCHRQGIARTLINGLLDACRSNFAIRKLTVNSSPYAVTIYRKLGFTTTDTELTVEGIRFTPMQYLL